MKTIKAIRTPTFENTCRFVCIDDFDAKICIDDFDTQKEGEYYLGTEIYTDYEHQHVKQTPYLRKGYANTDIKKEVLRNNWIPSPIGRNINDVFEKPDITMYRILGQLLKESGYVFNKKKGQIEKRKKDGI